jgi:hypothetical protein
MRVQTLLISCAKPNFVTVRGVVRARIYRTRRPLVRDARDRIDPAFHIPAIRIDFGYMGEIFRRANHVLVSAVPVVIDERRF